MSTIRNRRSLYPKSARLLNKNPLDWGLLGAVIALTIIGLVMIYDSSVMHAYKDYGDSYHYIKQQFIWVILGSGCLIFFSYFDYNFFKKFAIIGFYGALLLLIAVFIPGLGVSGGGAHRWLNLGVTAIQPSEIIKLASVIFFSTLFEKKVKTTPFLVYMSIILVIVGVFQKDLGTAIVITMLSGALYIVSGAPLKVLAYISPVVLVALIIFINSASYRLQRVKAFLDPFADTEKYTYHISQVLIALGSGGFFGLGLGQSRQKYEFVPEVTTDSIFSIVGEEFGFIGGLLLIMLFSFLIIRGFQIAENTEDKFGKLLAFGLISWIGIQATVNLAAMVSLIPLTGVPLPFISYGGSALLANMVAVGILLNISKHTKVTN